MQHGRHPRALALTSLALVALACGAPATPGTEDGGGPADAARSDAARPDGATALDAAAPDAQVGDAGAADGSVEVAHEREVRGVWIATVFNINWPSRSGLSADAQQAELVGLFDAAVRAGANAVFLQVRAEADAFYRSGLEPLSRFLTGTQGQDPGYDPLAFAVDAAHARGLELHAWMNPYRALASADASLAHASHVVRAQPSIVRAYGRVHWIDPGSPGGLAHTLAVIRDVLSRYDVDGLHFDDYFYPYPESGVEFDDDATYAAYQSAGGTLARDDWRRDNVHRMVEAVHALVREVRPDVRFGISPFGIYRPGMPEGIVGLDPVDALYADPLVWMREGWIDYVAPQLYWPTTRSGQAYDRLLDWWADRAVETGRWLLIGNYTAQLGSAPEWSVEELRTQLDLTRAARDRRARGNIHYHVDPIAEDRAGFATILARDFYGAPAASPPLIEASGPAPATPSVAVEGAEVVLAPSDTLRYWAAYREEAGAFVLRRLIPASEGRIPLWRGRWAISGVDRQSLEGRGAVVTIAEGEPPPIDPPPPPTGRSCTHSFGGVYVDRGCSASYQCCDGSWRMGTGVCGPCACVESSGDTGCGT